MPLQATIEAAEYEALPDTTVLGKDSFVKGEKEDKFFINLPELYKAQETVKKLEGNNKELLKQKGESNSKLKEFEVLGMTAEEALELINSKRPEEFQTRLAEKEKEIERIKKSAEEETAKYIADAEAAHKKLADTLLDVQVEQLVHNNQLRPSARFALRDHIRVERNAETGEYVKRVYENGEMLYSGPEPMKPEELIKSWREKKLYPELFEAGEGGGTGASNRMAATVNGSKVMKRSDWEQRSAHGEDFSKFFAEGGTLTD